MLKTINTKKSGFTLVEMLVAIAVFMIVMTVAVGSLISIIDANRKAQAIKNVVNNINFALESISKDMRVGTKYSCYDGTNYVGDCTGVGGIGVKYLSGKLDSGGTNYVIHYRFVSNPNTGMGNIQRCMNTDYNTACVSWESLTAPVENVKITNMKFYVLGTGTTGKPLNEKKQPRVIITLEGVAGIKDSVKTSFNIQTTVSQRIREVQN
jgi:prepilin-type N-terminal cleavage/methylation domain-containing protein